MIHLNKYLVLIFIVSASLNYSCKKFLEVDSPKDRIEPSVAFANDETATSAVTGIYSRMANTGFASGDQNSITVLNGLSADELISYNASLDVFFQANILSASSQINTLWANTYSYIYSSNAILEGLELTNSISESTKMQLRGEAKFVRAFCYFYLVNLFGEVPLNLTTDYRINEQAAKSSTEKLYAQIISDLIDAENFLSATYITSERIRPNKWAAKALLSRVYLFTGDWKNAALKATDVINQKNLYSLVEDLDKVFLKNSTETIWQLMPPAGTNTREGNLFILTNTPSSVSLNPNLLTIFDASDKRKTQWSKEFINTTGKYIYPFKYKVKSSTTINEYSMVMRLAELHLIRAEARAKLEQIELALEDVNLIRKRAGLIIPLTDLTAQQCFMEIEKQRRLELFTEWGHRWLDLKRTGRSTAILAPLKGATWKDTDILYPIPDNEINRNPNLGGQNLGY